MIWVPAFAGMSGMNKAANLNCYAHWRRCYHNL
jgi:hypothetical protein